MSWAGLIKYLGGQNAGKLGCSLEVLYCSYFQIITPLLNCMYWTAELLFLDLAWSAQTAVHKYTETFQNFTF